MTKVERALMRDRIERTVAGELTGDRAATEPSPRVSVLGFPGVFKGGDGSLALWRRTRKVRAEGRSFR